MSGVQKMIRCYYCNNTGRIPDVDNPETPGDLRRRLACGQKIKQELTREPLTIHCRSPLCFVCLHNLVAKYLEENNLPINLNL